MSPISRAELLASGSPWERGPTLGDVGLEMGQELVKSYGFRYENGEMSWSLENIGRAFEEEPIWTTLDWLVTAVPAFSWGKALRAVSKGSTLAGKALKGGEFARAEYAAGRGAIRRQVFGRSPTLTPFEQKIEAAKTYMRLPKARASGIGRQFESLMGKDIPEDMLGRYWDALDPDEKGVLARGFIASAKREQQASEAAAAWNAERLIKRSHRLPESERLEIRMLLEVADPEERARRISALSHDAQSIVINDIEWRDALHVGGYEAGLWSRQTFVKHEGRHSRHNYRPFYESDPDELARMGFGPLRPARTAQRKLTERTFARTEDLDLYGPEWVEAAKAKGLDPILDLEVAINEQAKTASLIALYRFGQRLEKSVFVRHVDSPAAARREGEMILADLIPGKDRSAVMRHPRVRRIDKALEKQDEALLRVNQKLREANVRDQKMPLPIGTRLTTEEGGRLAQRTILAPEVGQHTVQKWLRQQQRLERNIGKLGEAREEAIWRASRYGPYKNMPQEWKNLAVDPMAAQEIQTALQLQDLISHPFMKPIVALNNWFKRSKTLDNPATQVRNFLANIVFHSFATGQLAQVPSRGAKTMRAALKGDKAAVETMMRAREAGVIGHTLDQELAQDIMRLYGDLEKVADFETAFLGRFIPGLRHISDFNKAAYRAGDDVWKLDAFLRLEERLAKAGVEGGMRTARAAHEVTKYFPMYGDTTGFTQFVRQFVPFSSFTFEAARAWKNAMVWKPALALGWLNSADMLTEVMAGVTGVSQDELQAARQALPGWAEGKKTLLMPFRGQNNSVEFLDLSYLIPMADMAAEAERMEASFLGLPPDLNPLAGFGLTSNPVIGLAAAATTGKDPFTGRPIEPRFMEEQLGIVPPERIGKVPVRPAFGILEYLGRMLLPPLVPPGFAGVNLIELARQTQDPATGLAAEPDWRRTLQTNLLGLRVLAPDEPGARSRLWHEKDRIQQDRSHAWRRLDVALTNGDDGRVVMESQRLIELYGDRGEFLRRARSRFKNLGGGSLSKAERRAARAAALAAGGRTIEPRHGVAMFGDLVRILGGS